MMGLGIMQLPENKILFNKIINTRERGQYLMNSFRAKYMIPP
jgi:hypothetical protein